ncbi:MAG: efflux RND transporter permease subunit, partial [Gammaproteobacteria bacterium]|nr:efflux RND transporter permease subunit [Gammaproteobacteria bacterium]
ARGSAPDARPSLAWRAADLGVSTIDIADAARIATSGDIRQRLAKLNLAERQVPIRVQLAGSSLTDPAVLQQLRVPGKGGPVPLSAVADITEGSGPARIDRLNRERTVTVSAELNGLPLGDVMSKVSAMPAMQNLPPGVRILPAGDSEAFVELFVGFILALLAGIVSVYLVLVLLFHSGTQPIVILAAVPLCGGGAFGLLLLTGTALSLPSLIGLLLLNGIAVKNSILIVDYAILGEQAGMSRDEALIDACRKRARPVIMTTLAMGAGMLPIALGLGADGNFRTPLGVSVIGGLITSTLLSLVVVPAAYSVVAEITEQRLRPMLRRFLHH